MKVGRVVGTVVSTINSPVFEGRRLLLCDLLDASGNPEGGYLICVDTVGSGAGEAVLILDEGIGEVPPAVMGGHVELGIGTGSAFFPFVR